MLIVLARLDGLKLRQDTFRAYINTFRRQG